MERSIIVPIPYTGSDFGLFVHLLYDGKSPWISGWAHSSKVVPWQCQSSIMGRSSSQSGMSVFWVFLRGVVPIILYSGLPIMMKEWVFLWLLEPLQLFVGIFCIFRNFVTKAQDPYQSQAGASVPLRLALCLSRSQVWSWWISSTSSDQLSWSTPDAILSFWGVCSSNDMASPLLCVSPILFWHKALWEQPAGAPLSCCLWQAWRLQVTILGTLQSVHLDWEIGLFLLHIQNSANSDVPILC